MIYLTSFSTSMQVGSILHPLVLPMLNHAVTTLPCSQCTIMQPPPSRAPNAQSCSHHPPMLCVTSTYTGSYVSPVLSYNLIMQFLQSVTHLGQLLLVSLVFLLCLLLCLFCEIVLVMLTSRGHHSSGLCCAPSLVDLCRVHPVSLMWTSDMNLEHPANHLSPVLLGMQTSMTAVVL